MKPKIGDQVHFVIVRELGAVHLPAVITAVEDDTLELFVMGLRGSDTQKSNLISATFSALKEPGTWHWPEFVDGNHQPVEVTRYDETIVPCPSCNTRANLYVYSLETFSPENLEHAYRVICLSCGRTVTGQSSAHSYSAKVNAIIAWNQGGSP